MKICLVVHQFLPDHASGTEQYVRATAHVLQRFGHGVQVFSGDPSFDEIPRFAEREALVDDIPVHYLRCTPSLASNRVLNEFYNPFAAKRFGAFLDAHGFDLVHVFHCMYLGAAMIEEVELRGIALVVHFFDFWAVCPRVILSRPDGSACSGPDDFSACIACMQADAVSPYDFALPDSLSFDDLPAPTQSGLGRGAPRARLDAARLRPSFLREALERADVLVSPSAFLKAILVRNGYTADDIEVSPFAVADGLVPEPSARNNPGLRFGFIGSIVPHKGLHLLVDAFGALGEPHARLTIHGSADLAPGYAQALAERCLSDARVHLAGPFERRELASVLAEIDVLVVPSSWHENTPFVVYEAFATQTPVIASRMGGLEELVHDGENGLTFESGSVPALKQCLERCCGQPELLDSTLR